MSPETRRYLQTFLLVAFVVAGARVLWIFYQRRQPAPSRTTTASAKLNPDYYVYPPKAYLTDLKSAKALKGTTLWVRDGWRYTSQAYDAQRHRSIASSAPAALAPIQQVVVKDVITEESRVHGVEQVDVVYEDPSVVPPLRAVGVGACEKDGENCRFYLDQMFFLKDPHRLYDHWKPEVWKDIEEHRARQGMTEMQLNFALGLGRPLRGSERMVEFRPPNRAPLVVTFDKEGYARKIEEAQ